MKQFQCLLRCHTQFRTVMSKQFKLTYQDFVLLNTLNLSLFTKLITKSDLETTAPPPFFWDNFVLNKHISFKPLTSEKCFLWKAKQIKAWFLCCLEEIRTSLILQVDQGIWLRLSRAAAPFFIPIGHFDMVAVDAVYFSETEKMAVKVLLPEGWRCWHSKQTTCAKKKSEDENVHHKYNILYKRVWQEKACAVLLKSFECGHCSNIQFEWISITFCAWSLVNMCDWHQLF